MICNFLELGQLLSNKTSSVNLAAQLVEIERTLVYRSGFMHILYSFIELEYLSTYTYLPKADFLKRIESDIDILELFCQILSKRMFIMDDKEFANEAQSLSSSFLSLDKTEKVSLFLNFMAYCIFENEAVFTNFKHKVQLSNSANFIDDLSSVLGKLVNRMNRLRLWPDDFWVVNKTMI